MSGDSVPDDIWPCCYSAMWINNQDEGEHKIGAFLVRATNYEEACRKARDFARQVITKFGWPAIPWVCVNKVSGEPAIVDLENSSFKVTQGGDLGKVVLQRTG